MNLLHKLAILFLSIASCAWAASDWQEITFNPTESSSACYFSAEPRNIQLCLLPHMQDINMVIMDPSLPVPYNTYLGTWNSKADIKLLTVERHRFIFAFVQGAMSDNTNQTLLLVFSAQQGWQPVAVETYRYAYQDGSSSYQLNAEVALNCAPEKISFGLKYTFAQYQTETAPANSEEWQDCFVYDEQRGFFDVPASQAQHTAIQKSMNAYRASSMMYADGQLNRLKILTYFISPLRYLVNPNFPFQE